MGYDVIGEAHGHADALVALLSTLGIANAPGHGRTPTERPPSSATSSTAARSKLETVGIARRMVDAGNAVAVMGNHD